MSNVSKMYIKLNAYDTAVVNTAIKPVLGDLAVIIMPGSKMVLNRVVRDMQGCFVLGRPVEIRRTYEHGIPPYTMADVRDERAFYNSLQRFEQVLYMGLLKAERRRGFIDYQRITDYFFRRLNKTRRRMEQEGVQ